MQLYSQQFSHAPNLYMLQTESEVIAGQLRHVRMYHAKSTVNYYSQQFSHTPYLHIMLQTESEQHSYYAS